MRALPALLVLSCAFAQQPGETPASFQTSVTLVTVPVVVRDSKARGVGGLTKEDFRLSDSGKPQVIVKFSVERIGDPEARKATREEAAMPDRFVAYVFDDRHTGFSDLARARDATVRHLRSSLRPTDRAAIFTTSGQNMLDFTSDRDQLEAALRKLMPRPMYGGGGGECPPISFYEADLIVNRHDTRAISKAVAYVIGGCQPGLPAAVARGIVMFKAQEVLMYGELDSRITLGVLQQIVKRMASLPGRRSVVLASPGFLVPDLRAEESSLIDSAIRAGITINAIDPSGVSSETSGSTFEAAGVLAELAAGTGGRFFHNDNGLDEGIREVAAAPEFIYMLAFSPSDLKADGKYHTLKVKLANGKGLTVEARKGYFAPKSAGDPVQQAKEDLFEAVFTRDERSEFLVDVRTQYYWEDARTARAGVLARVPYNGIHFRKTGDRNVNDVTVVTAVFDGNGNLLTGKQQVLLMRVKDRTLERRAESGITGQAAFDLQPGSYLVRIAARDSEGRMSTRNTVLEIPVPTANDPAPVVEDIHLQAPFFYTQTGPAHVRVAAYLPDGAEGRLIVTGVAETPDGRPAAWFANTARPGRPFEDQFDLLPGEYILRLAFSAEGKEAGRREGRLSIEPRAPGEFALGGIVFSRDYRRLAADDIGQRDAGLDEPLSTLTSEHFEFPLAGSRRFNAADSAGFYVVLYDPLPNPGGRLTLQARAIDRKSGAVKWDSGQNDVSKYMDRESRIAALGVRLPLELLPAGDYRFELKASDPAGRIATRTADFEVR